MKDNAGFTPQYKKKGPGRNSAPLTGVSIRNLPVDVTSEETTAMLTKYGLPNDPEKMSIKKFRRTAAVDLENIDDDECKNIMSSLNSKEELG